jgi:hypothetical protein
VAQGVDRGLGGADVQRDVLLERAAVGGGEGANEDQTH